MQLWLCPLLAFLGGSIPFGLLIAKAKGINIREHGSGNIGATNVLRVVGKKYGISCLLLDALKGFIPVVIAISLIRFEGMKNPMSITALAAYAQDFPMLTAQIFQVITGLCAVLGHNYSPWVGFKGGKGIATSAGVFIALMPAAIVILIAVWLLVFLVSRYVSLASIIAAAVLPLVTLWGSWFHGKIQNGTWNKPLFAFTVIIAVLAVWKHRGNIERLRSGTEHRFTRKSKPADV
ncbi:MAG: glycerol-3-phosphate 1-O-acyltransferase PlsY [Verrucomicrobiota bacterium]|jgi:glycerol-3-phosphate acyltransferase PlsY